MNHTNLTELLTIAFEAMLPERQQHCQQYTMHLTILKFLVAPKLDW